MRDPIADRKPGATGVSVPMADGREWLVRRPRSLFTPDDNEDGYRLSFDLGPEYDAAWSDFTEPAGTKAFIRAFFRLATMLLRANYDLATEDLKALLVLDFAEPDAGAEPSGPQLLRRDLEEIITGTYEAPKPSPGGSGSAG